MVATYHLSQFYHPMNLHCSQTRLPFWNGRFSFTTLWIYVALKLIYQSRQCIAVLPPYEFTLLSNSGGIDTAFGSVLPPYEFTLLSNCVSRGGCVGKVLPPYEFTLLSNRCRKSPSPSEVLPPYEFTLLSNCRKGWEWRGTFYHPMNLHCSQTDGV